MECYTYRTNLLKITPPIPPPPTPPPPAHNFEVKGGTFAQIVLCICPPSPWKSGTLKYCTPLRKTAPVVFQVYNPCLRTSCTHYSVFKTLFSLSWIRPGTETHISVTVTGYVRTSTIRVPSFPKWNTENWNEGATYPTIIGTGVLKILFSLRRRPM